MRKVINRIRAARRDERGAEAVAMIFVIPVLVVLVLGLVDVGVMFQNRMAVENVVRDAARNAAADGGNYNKRTNSTGKQWDDVAFRTLYSGNKCQLGSCQPGKRPTVNCTKITSVSGGVYNSNTVARAGDVITCRATYPYKPINGPLLNGPLGLGIGTLLKPFTFEVSARSETGDISEFGG